MDDSNKTVAGQAGASNRALRALLYCLVGLILLVLAGTAFFAASQQTPGIRLVYEIVGNSAAEEAVRPLQRRLDGVGNTRVKVQALDARQIEVVVASRDLATIDRVKQLIESAGLMRFLILANPADHDALIAAATTQASSDSPDSKSRDVRGQDGSIIGRWVTAAREGDPKNATRPLRVNVSNATVRDAGTGKIISLPPEVRRQDAEVAIAQWIDQQGIEALEALMAIDPNLEVGGTDLAFAAATIDANGSPAIAFILTDAASKRFFALTTQNSPVGDRQRQLGIILDDQLLSAPNILQAIRKEGRITGKFTQAEVEGIVRVLKAGQLPVELRKGATSETPVDVPFRVADLFQGFK